VKTWTQLQEWVELEGDHWAKEVIKASQASGRNGPSDLYTMTESVLGLEYAHDWDNLPEVERQVYCTAVAWKAAELAAKEYASLAEGWCETYYRDLKRMYEEES